MRLGLVVIVSAGFIVSGCSLAQKIQGPAFTIDSGQSDLAIRAFVDSSIYLAHISGYHSAKRIDNTIPETQIRSLGRVFENLRKERDLDHDIDIGEIASGEILARNRPFQTTPELTVTDVRKCYAYPGDGTAIPSFNGGKERTYECMLSHAIYNYVYSGWQLSMMMCREYITGLEERRVLYDRMKNGLNGIESVQDVVQFVTSSSDTAKIISDISLGTLKGLLSAISQYDYLGPSSGHLKNLVVGAQYRMGAKYGLEKPIATKQEPNPTPQALPKNLVGAINVLHNVQYQCSRAGIANLMNVVAEEASRRMSVDEAGNLILNGDG